MEVKNGERGWNRLKLKQEDFSKSPFVAIPNLSDKLQAAIKAFCSDFCILRSSWSIFFALSGVELADKFFQLEDQLKSY